MYFEVGGSGKDIVLFLHGWGGSSISFSGVAASLSSRFKVINLDFPGFGKSKEPNMPWSVEDYAMAVKRLLDELGASQVSVVAHSFGGRVAIKLAYLFPEIIDKLVLVDSAGLRPRRGIKYFFSVRRYKLLKFLVTKGLMSPEKLKSRGSSDYRALSDNMKKTFVKVVNEDLKNNAKTINAETLIIWGESDLDTPLYMAKKLKKYIIGSELIVLPGCGHFAYLEKFGQFIKILDAFL